MGVDCEPRWGLDVAYVVFSSTDIRPLVVHLHPLDPQAPVLQDTGSALGDLAVLAPPDDGRRRVPASLTLELHVLVLLDKDILGRSGEAWFVWKKKRQKVLAIKRNEILLVKTYLTNPGREVWQKYVSGD